MSETLFILTTIFVAYVVYKTVNEQKAMPNPTVTKAKTETPKVSPEQQVTEIVPETKKPATVKKITPTAIPRNIAKKGLKDPETGEVATSYSNYRFTKRWIKDALVAEGLLEKVYKNNEIDTAIESTIKDAIIKLEAIEKYKP